MKTTIIENSSNWSHGPQPCLTQWNYVHKVLFVPSKSLFPQSCISSGIRSHHFMANRWGNNGNSDRLYFGGLQNQCRWWLHPWNLKALAPWKKSYDQPRQHIKKQRHYFANKGPSIQSCGFSSSHVWMWELDYIESWAPKNWCFWTVVLEKTLESPLDCKEIQPVHPKGNQIWILLEGLMLKLKLQYFGRLKRPWCWERLKVGREGDYKGWDGWTASLTQWTWVWASSGSWWWTGTPGVLQSMGSQRVRHDWATEPNWQVLGEDLVSALAAAAGILVNNWDRGKTCLRRNSRAMSWREPGPPSQPLTA